MRKSFNRKDLIDYLKLIQVSLPLKFSTYEGTYKTQVKAFQMLVEKFPEITTFPYPFEEIYAPGKSPEQMAYEILYTGKMVAPAGEIKPRGLSEENKVLLDVDRFLFNSVEVLQQSKIKMEEEELTSLFRIANYLRNKGDSIDKFLDTRGYSDEERKILAKGLGAFYEVNILFREELYKDYKQKGKAIKILPETGVYYKDVVKRESSINPMKKLRSGKKIKRETLERDVDDFRKYLLGSDYTHYRDRAFYDAKRFRYLAFLVSKISSILDVKLSKIENKSLKHFKKAKASSLFSIDKYLDEILWKPRDSHSVGFFRIPLAKTEGTCHAS